MILVVNKVTEHKGLTDKTVNIEELKITSLFFSSLQQIDIEVEK